MKKFDFSKEFGNIDSKYIHEAEKEWQRKTRPWTPRFWSRVAAACVIKVVGYYIAEVVIYGNPVAPVASIPGNLVQIGVAAVITLVVIAPLNVAAKRTGLKK